ncbi:indole-3-glycerol phosphate synthase TrpC [Anaerocolumna sp. AGMB13020]|uniref:indole-3-glycerol phosphate synthase TrpC n=1 Tax=Anaerocolumna sp. AGMB13020 TaxID=3081750 RepID=UPI0029543D66|nr:indole-3-glycerol phosphate synthase TrpC [Anaerocolumna sp. AGMB13020]WOO37211.1 indole-3-glycerol phosphate synthase TrpC [Anaerocolumna sp. AGMB13020]
MILDNIVAATRIRVEKDMERVSFEAMQKKARMLSTDTGFPFEAALRTEGITFICEVKKASPSKGVIAEEFPYVSIAKEYEKAGAGCISVLTEPDFFLGSDAYLTEIREEVSIPLLRKDFIVDAYQLYQAKTLGADAVLLICAILSQKELEEYLNLSHELGLSALVEAHDEEEVFRAVKARAGIIGVNNRDLKTFEVDIRTSERLRKLVPENILFVAESGIKTPDDIRVLKEAGVNGVLIGETFMKSNDKKAALAELRGDIL